MNKIKNLSKILSINTTFWKDWFFFGLGKNLNQCNFQTKENERQVIQLRKVIINWYATIIDIKDEVFSSVFWQYAIDLQFAVLF